MKTQKMSKAPAKKSFAEAAKELEQDELTPAEAAALEDPETPVPPRNVPRSGVEAAEVDPDGDEGIPEWVKVPEGFKKPPKGKKIIVLRFKAEWTDDPSKGDRQCIVWSLTLSDERNAITRARGVRERLLSEMTMATIRYIDGEPVDWTRRNRAADPVVFFDEIGPKCRAQLENIYNAQHNLNAEDQLSFFGECLHVVEAATG